MFWLRPKAALCHNHLVMDRKEAAARAFRMSLAEVRERVQNALLLAGAVMLASAPMFYYQFSHLMGSVFKKVPTEKQLQLLSVGQALIIFALALLCSLVGFLYAERLSLPGFGKISDLKRWLPAAVGLGLALLLPWYFLSDRFLMGNIPEAYPGYWPWALSLAVGNALSQEVVARFGLLSIGVYLLRWRGYNGHPTAAIAVVSLFATVCSLLFLVRLNLSIPVSPARLMASLAAVFILQWVLAEVYIRKGLVPAMALHLGLGARLIVYALMF
jgi:hypothetical protein